MWGSRYVPHEIAGRVLNTCSYSQAVRSSWKRCAIADASYALSSGVERRRLWMWALYCVQEINRRGSHFLAGFGSATRPVLDRSSYSVSRLASSCFETLSSRSIVRSKRLTAAGTSQKAAARFFVTAQIRWHMSAVFINAELVDINPELPTR